jgi:hypothetical protein
MGFKLTAALLGRIHALDRAVSVIGRIKMYHETVLHGY